MKKIRLKIKHSKDKDDDVIVKYKGNNYYKVRPNGKITIGALHCLKGNPKTVEDNLHTIKHTKTIGMTPSQFVKRDFYNRVSGYQIKVEKFDVNNLYIGDK